MCELEDEQLESISGGAAGFLHRFKVNDLVKYSNTCISCKAWRPTGRIMFTLSDGDRPAYGVQCSCCGYLFGCTEEKLTPG